MVEWSLSRTEMIVLSGTGNPPLSAEIAAFMDLPLCEVTLRRFADGEIFVRIDENARGRDVYIIQSTNPPAENLLELLLLIDAPKRASAARVTAVVPYFGYARQDRKDQPRVAISAKLVANLIETAGCDRVLGIDFHQAIIAALVIACNGWRLLLPALNELMDKSPGTELIRQICQIAESTPGAERVEKCLVRKTGYHFYVDMHLEVHPEMTVQRSHNIAHEVKDRIRTEIPAVRDVLVHIEPAQEQRRDAVS